MLKNYFINNRSYYASGFIVFTFLLSFSFPKLLIVGKVLLLLFFIGLVTDAYLLYQNSKNILLSRFVLEKMSLGEVEKIIYSIINNSSKSWCCELVDELPTQFQHRSYVSKFLLNIEDNHQIDFEFRSTERGIYNFGKVYLYIHFDKLGFLQRKLSYDIATQASVYPSIIQMKRYQLQVFSKTANQKGIRNTRAIGESDEFELIKQYQQGDNIKSINWKATSRKNVLMVNQYQNTRSQVVYCVIDKGRSMQMPFYDMSLLDHSINAALVMSNIVLRKYDKIGLVTFSNKIGSIVKASSHSNQLEKISDKLYAQQTKFKESNFELLFYTFRKYITRRSILLFFTNFEHVDDMKRNLPYLRSLSKSHLLVVISFINTELETTAELNAFTKKSIYLKTMAQKVMIDKEKIVLELQRNGIQTILTTVEDLSIKLINKYLEIKSKRMR